MWKDFLCCPPAIKALLKRATVELLCLNFSRAPSELCNGEITQVSALDKERKTGDPNKKLASDRPSF